MKEKCSCDKPEPKRIFIKPVLALEKQLLKLVNLLYSNGVN